MDIAWLALCTAHLAAFAAPVADGARPRVRRVKCPHNLAGVTLARMDAR